MALTQVAIEKAVAKTVPYKMVDGRGLYLLVQPSGSKLWRWNYKFGGKQQTMTFGAFPEVSLKRVRIKHTDARALLSKGVNPMRQRKQEKEARWVEMHPAPIARHTAGDPGTFAWVQKQWFEKWKAGKSPRHAKQVKSRVETDILPSLGHRPITEIEAPEIVEVALAIQERGAVDLAHRSLHTMGQIFRYGIARGYNRRNPVAEIKGSDFLKGVDSRNFARVGQSELPDLLLEIERYVGFPTTRIVIKLMVRTFLRTSELILAPWSELSFRGHKLLETKWTIPAERMKMPTPHIVPLSHQAAALLEELHRYTGGTQWLFPNMKDPARCMSKNTILNALETMGYKGKMTGHGFRGLASTILHEQGYEDDHIEIQLAHQERNSTKAAYNYAKYLEPRAKMMQHWSDFLDRQLCEAKASEGQSK
jgi:integrase